MMKVGKVMVGSSDWRAEDGGRGSPRPPSCLFGGFLRHQIADAAQLAEQRAAALALGGRHDILGLLGAVEDQPHQLRPGLARLGALADLGIGFSKLSRLADQLGVKVYGHADRTFDRSEEHTSELQSLMRISYAVFCLK